MGQKEQYLSILLLIGQNNDKIIWLFNQNALEINVYMHHVTIKIYDTIVGERKIQPWQRLVGEEEGVVQISAILSWQEDEKLGPKGMEENQGEASPGSDQSFSQLV